MSEKDFREERDYAQQDEPSSDSAFVSKSPSNVRHACNHSETDASDPRHSVMINVFQVGGSEGHHQASDIPMCLSGSETRLGDAKQFNYNSIMGRKGTDQCSRNFTLPGIVVHVVVHNLKPDLVSRHQPHP